MRTILITISLAALVVLFVGPTLYAMGLTSADFGQYSILAGTVGWFATAPFWIRHH
jgi:hypothetical protein